MSTLTEISFTLRMEEQKFSVHNKSTEQIVNIRFDEYEILAVIHLVVHLV